MTQEWYYQQNGQKHGPISGTDLKQLAAIGKLGPTDHVWKEGMAKWVSACSVKGLFPAAAAPVATAIPPLPSVKAAPPSTGGAGEVVEVKPASAKPSMQDRVMGLVGKAKRLWQPLGTPAKAGIVGGAVGGVFLLLLLFCVLPLRWFFGSGGGAGAVPVKELLQNFLNDRQAAEKKYLGQTVTVRGVITDIMNEHFGSPAKDDGNVVKLETGSVPGEVTCTFSLKYAKKIMELGKGKEIVLRGRCTKYNTGKWKYAGKETDAGFLELEDCELLEKGSEQVAEGGKKTGQNVAGGSYTEKAMKTKMAKRFKGKLKDVRPGSRDDFIQALAVLGTPLESQGKHQWQGNDGRVHSKIIYHARDVQPIREATYAAVFGTPEIVSEVMFGEVFKGWRHQCTDGPVNMGGSLPDPTAFPETRVYHVTSIAIILD